MKNLEYRKLDPSQLNVLKKYDQKCGDGHGHLMIKDFTGQKMLLDEHDVDDWYIKV